MKKGYLKVLAAVAAVAMLMSMSLSVFADAPTYTTTTTYNTSDETVNVVTEVTGVGAEDQVAYLVTNNDSEEIIWVDQQPADGEGKVTFSFSTDAANAKGAGSQIKVGSTTKSAADFDSAAENLVKLANYTVTVETDGNGKVEANAVSVADGQYSATDGDEVEFTVYPAAGYEFDKCVIQGQSDPVVWVDGSTTKKVKVTANVTYVFSFKPVEATLGTPAQSGAATVTTNDAGKKVGSVAGNATGASEFGILVINAASAETLLTGITASEVAALENMQDANGVRKYQALGATEAGDYVISLVDDNDVFFTNGASYKAVMYALKDGSLKLSDVFTWSE